MNTYQHVVWAVPVTVLLIIFAGTAFADIPVNAVPELAGLSTTTSMDVQGTAMSNTAMNLQLGTGMLDNPPLENGGYLWVWWADVISPPIIGYTVDPFVASIYLLNGIQLPLGEVQYTAGYNEEVTAVSGNLIYQKTTGISTANKTSGEDNIAADRILTFTGEDGGRMTTGEDIIIDGTGAQTVSGNQAYCPFASDTNPFFPPFCNIAMSGSSADISTGSISTAAGVRVIAASADVPVTETYLINAKGVTMSAGYTNASGTVSAFMKAHVQEGIEQPVPREFASDPLGFIPVKAEDISYSETSAASGSINSFAKNMQYQSGIRLV